MCYVIKVWYLSTCLNKRISLLLSRLKKAMNQEEITMNSITKFDVFEFLEMEIKQVVSALDKVLASYAQMNNNQRSDAVRRIFCAVERCLATDAILFEEANKRGLSVGYVASLHSSHRRLRELIGVMVMEHLDDNSFFKHLAEMNEILLSETLENVRRFHNAIVERASQEDMRKLESTLANRIVLRD